MEVVGEAEFKILDQLYQWGEHIRTPDIVKLLHFMVFSYLFLAETDTNPPTNSKSMFQHSFPPLHPWSHLRRTNPYTYQWGEHIRTPDIAKLLHFMVFGYLFLTETDMNSPTNSKSMFQHSFPLLHSWSRLRRTPIPYTYQWSEHIRTPDIVKLLRFMISVTFFWLKRIPIHQLTPNLYVSTFVSTSTFMISS